MKNTKNNLKKFFYIFVSLCVGLIVFSYAEAATYYVSTAGNDSNAGSQTFPWKTIQKAANTMLAGDTSMVLPGTYNERVVMSRSGSAGAPITFLAAERGKVIVGKGFEVQKSGAIAKYVIIDGFEITIPRQAVLDDWSVGSGVSLIDTQYCEVRNNHIYHTLREGIMVFTSGADNSTNSSYNKIVGNNIEYAGGYAGITVNGAYQLIENNDISHTIQNPLYPIYSTADGADADGIKFSGTGHIFRGNYIHDITLSDYGNSHPTANQDEPHVDCIQSWGSISNMVFEKNNLILTNPGTYTQGIYSDEGNAPGLVIKNNVFQVCQPLNLWFSTGNGPTILNNTFRSLACPSDRCDNGRCDAIQLGQSPNSIIKNNMFYNVRNFLYLEDTGSKTGLQVSNNGFTNAGGANLSGINFGSNPVNTTSPNFVDAANYNYRLQEASLLIDRGIDVGVFDDLDGVARPQNGAFDIGAFEYKAATPPPENNAPVASNSSVSLSEDLSQSFKLNAIDADEDVLTYVIVSQPGNGSLSGTGENLVYTPVANYNGSDVVTFKVNDGLVDSNIATVSITITAANDAPLTPQGLTASVGGTDRITLSWYAASDPDNGDTVKYNLYRGATAIASNLAALSYLNTGLLANTSYSYQVEAIDASGVKSAKSSVVSATTQAKPNVAPVANNQSITVNEDTAKTIALTATDADGDVLTFRIVANPSHGSLSGSGASRTYTPAADYNGSDSFTFKANDSKADSNTATVSISVSAVSDIPVPDAPVRLRASRISSNTIKVSWTDHSNYEDGFELQRKKGKSGTFTTIAKVSPAPDELTRVNYEDSGLVKGNYYYRVRAYNSIGQSAFSNTYSAQIL